MATAADSPRVELALRNLNFFCSKHQAPYDISLESRSGRSPHSSAGPAGYCKSTLLRRFNRIYELYPKQRTHGEILLDGENILGPKQDLNGLRAKVGMVFQEPPHFR